jgi:NCS1 family nucleobase:cation symporter-1
VSIQVGEIPIARTPSETSHFNYIRSIQLLGIAAFAIDMSRYFRWAELPARQDIYQDRGTTKWGNHDLYPIVEEERTYGKGAYMLYWLTAGAGLSTFALGSSYTAVGLTAGQACGAILIGTIITSAVAVLCGKAGADKHLGYVSEVTNRTGYR